MSRVVIKASGLGKEYAIGAQERGAPNFREMLMSAIAAPFDRFRRLAGHAPEVDRIWALKNVSFEVKEGEIIGVIGRNGAGKSTLLKILSRITTPTTGRAEIRGRVGSLLEVGTGFHSELTGRENLYLNGAILGMSRSEIRKKFDEIVEFSGIETFLDTPVKHYSSGMGIRLAFAVAAHLETEILLVDEVLAVGDVDFQRKCLGKMSDVAHSGRTILFVSHNMAAIENLCNRGFLLRDGMLTSGTVEEAIRQYNDAQTDQSGDIDVTNHPRRIPGAKPLIRSFRLLNGTGEPTSQIGMGDNVEFAVELQLRASDPSLVLGIHINNWLGQRVVTFHTRDQLTTQIDGERVLLRCKVPHLDLMPGPYHIVVAVYSSRLGSDRIDPVARFDVLTRDVFGTGRVPPAGDGVFFSRAEWTASTSFREAERPEDDLKRVDMGR
jgi:lipopolysaccharide transport system ATP-binding protein